MPPPTEAQEAQDCYGYRAAGCKGPRVLGPGAASLAGIHEAQLLGGALSPLRDANLYQLPT